MESQRVQSPFRTSAILDAVDAPDDDMVLYLPVCNVAWPAWPAGSSGFELYSHSAEGAGFVMTILVSGVRPRSLRTHFTSDVDSGGPINNR